MQLTSQQIEHFHEHGYLIAPEVVTEADLNPVIKAIEAEVDRRANALYAQGKITELHTDAPFDQRIALLHAQHPSITEQMDIQQLRNPALLTFMACQNLLDAIECLVGPHITMNPIQHLRPKMPQRDTAAGLAGSVPWHQDIGVMWEEADDSNVITCWMPLIDATEETGCMGIIPDAHQRGFLEHGTEGGTHILPHLIEKDEHIIAECPRRGAVFMTPYTPHCGLPNVSNRVRWTLDLRYQPTGQPTGRPFHPAFVVREPDNPTAEQRDFDTWCERWDDALANAGDVAAHRVAPIEKRQWAKGQV